MTDEPTMAPTNSPQHLDSRPARPSRRRRTPAYPRVLGMGSVLLLSAACGGSAVAPHDPVSTAAPTGTELEPIPTATTTPPPGPATAQPETEHEAVPGGMAATFHVEPPLPPPPTPQPAPKP